jgi:hypothetical protein
MEHNIRYGVVNFIMREMYEKDYQLAYGYDFITRSEKEAIRECKKFGNKYAVEKIYDDPIQNNLRVEIFRGGSDEENG